MIPVGLLTTVPAPVPTSVTLKTKVGAAMTPSCVKSLTLPCVAVITVGLFTVLTAVARP